ncbi:MAG: amidophosphoribosyltransferase [Candidatus Methanomethylophilaceae archaeon]|nr:amidophosphoribosyltransferase [Candidatus Methanomethylophilaceae archaeon]
MAGPKHSCGVVGVAADCDVVYYMHRALNVIQHRGQESAGISVFTDGAIRTVKNDGLVSEALSEAALAGLAGNSGIGHVRYSTVGSKGVLNAQPFTVDYTGGTLAIAHNGDLTNYRELKAEYLEKGWSFISDSDSEIIVRLIAKFLSEGEDIITAIRSTMAKIDGAYSLCVMDNDVIYAIRDPHGFRPLCIGKVFGGYMVVSESAALDSLGGEFVRDVEPGEIVRVTKDGIESFPMVSPGPKAHCMFEWIYFARPDSVMDGREVYDVRKQVGIILAKEAPADVDLVMPVPDSGRAHALGYSIGSGIQYEEGFMKNRFVGRTFILPDQKMRENAVSMKMNAIKSTVNGKRIVIVDDSIVRGTTLKKLINVLRDAGAKEVHVRIGSPPIIAPCYYGVDMKSRDQFIATKYNVEEIRQIIGADSLAYISLDGMVKALGFPAEDLCLECTNGLYPTPIEGEKLRPQ